MAVRYVFQDITTAEQYLIGHGCNARGEMNTGVARAIRERWPNAFYQYAETYDYYGLNVGQVVFVETDNKVIANIVTQQNFGYDGQQYVDYDGLRMGLNNVVNYMRYNNIWEIALPKIGAARGGGDWSIILMIIEEVFQDRDVIIYEWLETPPNN